MIDLFWTRPFHLQEMQRFFNVAALDDDDVVWLRFVRAEGGELEEIIEKKVVFVLENHRRQKRNKRKIESSFFFGGGT